MRSHLLNDTTAEHYRRSVTEGVERVAAKLATTERPFTGVTVDALAPASTGSTWTSRCTTPAAVLDELEEVYLRDAVYFHHPRYLAHLNCPVVIPAVLGEAVLSAVNSSLDTWDQSAGGTLIERRLIDWTADAHRPRPGRRRRVHQRRHASPTCRRCCWPARRPPRVATAEAVLPELRILASEVQPLQRPEVRQTARPRRRTPWSPSPSTATSACRPSRSPASWSAAGARASSRWPSSPPPAPPTSAPSTRCPRSPTLCEQYGAWMHVDAAYGCGLLASRTPRHLLDGIERADSVTVDYHKSFFQPVSSSPPCWSATRPPCATPPTTRSTSTRARMVAGAHPQPGRQVPPDHPPLRRAQAVDDAARHGRRRRRRALRRGRATWPPRAGGCSPPTRASTSSSSPSSPPSSSATSPAAVTDPADDRPRPTCTPARPCSPPATPWSRAPRSTAATT